MSIPQTLDGFTAEWFSDCLGWQIDEAKLLEINEGTTGRAKFSLTGDSRVPKSLFVKIPPKDEAQRQFVKAVGMGYTEVGFYKQLASEVPVRVPRPYYSAFENDNFVMVLEDLSATGCQYVQPEDKDIVFRGRNIVEELAGLHAKYWQSERFSNTGDLAWLAMHGTGSVEGSVPYVKMAIDAVSKDMPDFFKTMATFYLDNAPHIVELWNAGPKTIVHGDAHFNNLFVDVKNGRRTGFLDWALLSHAVGMRDVAYVLANSVPVEVRRTHEKDWIKRYCEILQKGNINYSFDQAWDHYRLLVVYSWVAASASAAMGAKWQPVEVNLASLKRATDACEQLDSIGLIKSVSL